MPFIQIAPNRYINSDHVRGIIIKTKHAVLSFSGNDVVVIDIAAARYFLVEVEAREALETIKPDPPSLKTRIAQALRYDFPQGATTSDLTDNLTVQLRHEKGIKTRENTNKALAELVNAKILIAQTTDNLPTVYIHASNARQSPDSSAATAVPEKNPADNSEHSSDH